jgi:hypothetical protein
MPVASSGRSDEVVSKEQAAAVRDLQLKESIVARSVLAEMTELQRCHGAWLEWLHDTEANTASSDDLLDLLRSAPTAFAKGLLFGKFQLRVEAAARDGRCF